MSLDSDIRDLGSVPIFAHLGFEARRLIAFSAETRILRAGDVLFRKGDKSDGGYFVLSGTISIDYSKDEERAVKIVQRHHLIGETALLAETVRTSTAVAREPSSVLKISRDLFCRVLREFPESAESMRRSMQDQLSEFVNELTRFKGESDRAAVTKN